MPQRGKPILDASPLKVQATVEIGALAKYEIKKTITESVPEDVTRAKNSAWLTLLSPFTHWAGLIGDRLAHKRELLRIHQEEALNAVMRHAAPKLASLKLPVKPIPIKFLVPFLENASLEKPDSRLVEMWANLLVSSAENYSESNVYYVRLLSQMSSVQARLFETMIGPKGPKNAMINLEVIYFVGQDFFSESEHIKEAFQNAKKPPVTLRQAWRILVKNLNIQGVVIEHIDLGAEVGEDYTSGTPSYSTYIDKHQNDYSILRGLGLIEYRDTGYFVVLGRWKVKVMVHYVSALGLAFAEACGVQAQEVT